MYTLLTWFVIGASSIGEAEQDVLSGTLVQVGEQFLDAEFKHHRQSGIVGL